ncbi:hypothetical protein D9757_013504 [Collybiopsis confluens]|uniref:Uncharacterized protein n=1 Tax=Collybiopsis confluens TaxID=2823264 RepID=A0A8H5CTM6_9AGAR|nr:hypothetical protein D9757_013504 [Collybiopsis confluens]
MLTFFASSVVNASESTFGLPLHSSPLIHLCSTQVLLIHLPDIASFPSSGCLPKSPLAFHHNWSFGPAFLPLSLTLTSSRTTFARQKLFIPIHYQQWTFRRFLEGVLLPQDFLTGALQPEIPLEITVSFFPFVLSSPSPLLSAITDVALILPRRLPPFCFSTPTDRYSALPALPNYFIDHPRLSLLSFKPSGLEQRKLGGIAIGDIWQDRLIPCSSTPPRTYCFCKDGDCGGPGNVASHSHQRHSRTTEILFKENIDRLFDM